MEIGSSYLLSNKMFLLKHSEKLVPKLEDHKKYPYLINDTLQRTLLLFSWVKKAKCTSPPIFLSEFLEAQKHFLRSIMRRRTSEIIKSKNLLVVFILRKIYFTSEVTKEEGRVRRPKTFKPNRISNVKCSI